MIYIWYHIRYHEMACTWYYIRYHEMVPVTLQYIPTIYEGYFGYCRYIPRTYGNAYTVTWLVPKFRRFHLSEICGGYRTSGHKTDIVNHIPDIILDSLITYLVYSFVQEYTKYITVLWQNIYKYIYIYMSGIFKTIFHFQVTGVWPQMVLRKDIKCATQSTRLLGYWPEALRLESFHASGTKTTNCILTSSRLEPWSESW